jgi:hypothetical protein
MNDDDDLIDPRAVEVDEPIDHRPAVDRRQQLRRRGSKAGSKTGRGDDEQPPRLTAT